MINFDINKIGQINLCQSDKDAVFLSASDGSLLGANKLANKLISEINLFEKFLPEDHQGLVQACSKTRHSLKRKRDLDGLNIIWTYQVFEEVEKNKLDDFGVAANNKGSIYLCAQGFSNSNTSALTEWLEAQSIKNPLPEMLFDQNGELKFTNLQAKQWLSDFNLVEIKDMLPFNHNELIRLCYSDKISLTDARGVDGKTYVWTYEPSIEGVKVYARDLSVVQCEIPEHKKVLHKNYNLELTVDESGSTKCINYAAYKLLDELELSFIDDILPSGHMGLIKACRMTNTLLTDKCKLENRNIIWSYQPDDDGSVVNVFGYETT